MLHPSFPCRCACACHWVSMRGPVAGTALNVGSVEGRGPKGSTQGLGVRLAGVKSGSLTSAWTGVGGWLEVLTV